MDGAVQGGCVVVGLVVTAFAIVFAVSPDAGILSLWVVGVWMLVHYVRKSTVSDSSTTPPPEEGTPSGDVFAGESVAIDRVERGPEGVMFIVHPVRIEVTEEEDQQ